MEYEVERRDGVALVRLTGSMDGLTADAVRGALNEAAAAERPQVVADLTGVDFASSEGLRVLLSSMKDSRRRGGDLRLAAAQGEVVRLLDFAGFNTIFKVFSDVDSAVESFGS